MLEITQAKYSDNYTLWLQYNDGKAGYVDLTEHLWGPAFEPLRDINRFKQFHISPMLGTITWENDVDFAPEFLYEQLSEKV